MTNSAIWIAHSVLLRLLLPNEPPERVTGVTVAPKTNNLEVGATRQLNVAIEPEDIDADTSYSSSDDAVATVDDNGLVTAIGEGTATITVTADDVTDIATVNVTGPEPDPED